MTLRCRRRVSWYYWTMIGAAAASLDWVVFVLESMGDRMMDGDGKSRYGWVLILLAAVGFFPGARVSAAVLQHARNYILPGSEVIHDDLYVGGTVVDVQGTIEGDLVVFGQTITIGGIVTGDVIAAGRDVTVSGSIGGTLRAAGSSLTVDGTVGHDVVAGCGTFVIGSHANIGRDVLSGSGTASISGRVARDVRVAGGSATLSGWIGGTAHARSRELRLADGALVEHDLVYTSRREVAKAPGATVRGRIERRAPREGGSRGPFGGSPVIHWIRGLIGLLILGFLYFLIFIDAGRRTLATLESAPWLSLGWGALLFFAVPIAAVFFFLFGLFLGGWWLAAIALVLYVLALSLGYVVSATLLGRWILRAAFGREVRFAWAIVTGLVILGFATVLPFLGKLVGLFAILFGFGALLLAWARARRPGAGASLAGSGGASP